jgi:predicted ArsR family transcriptional regulator
MAQRARPDRIAALAALDDPVRREVFDFVTRSGVAVDRETAAGAVNVSRRMAAFHLDRLAEQGLLAVEYRRPAGRVGPGAGRPAKWYKRVDTEVTVSVPERQYELLGGLLAAAVAESIDSGTPVQQVLERTVYEAGQAIGESAAGLPSALEESGYEPRQPDPHTGAVTLSNCPFHRLAKQYTELVCGINLHLLRGIAEGVGDQTYVMVLDPGPGQCCVRLLPAP